MEAPDKMIKVLGHQPGNALEKRPMVGITMLLTTNERFPLCAYVTKWMYAYTPSCNTLRHKMAKNSTTTGCFPLIVFPIVVFTIIVTLLTAVMVDFYVSVDCEPCA